ncbi:MAG: peptidoglycan-binding domain-containing protein, partial [Syntrophomonas sp.]|nr:peptidoglycan-binding domain-containing protein [Syntrophomonas sp.]
MRLVKRVLIMAVILSGVLLLYSNDAMAAEPNLQWGSRGSAVVELQKTLNNQGFWCGAADGIFGAKTYN